MIKAYYEIEKFGKKHYKTDKIKSKSFVIGMMNWMYAQMVSQTASRMPGIGGDNLLDWDTTANGEDYGILIGTGTTTVAPTQTSLITKITSGTTSGEMVHLPQWYTMFSIAGSTASFVVERLFKNDSGSTITVNELGMQTYGSSGSYFILRDKLTVGVSVLNTEYLKVKYTISVTV